MSPNSFESVSCQKLTDLEVIMMSRRKLIQKYTEAACGFLLEIGKLNSE